MLPTCILTKYNLRSSNRVLLQWLKVNVKWCSSSDSSSDSDSDSEKVKRKGYVKSTKSTTPHNKNDLGSFLINMIEQTTPAKVAKDVGKTSSEKVTKENTKTATGSANLTEYVNNMLKARKLQKTIDVAMQPRKKLSDASGKGKKMSYEKRLASAAEDVATTLGGDKKKTTSDLLQKVLLYKEKSSARESEQLKDTDNIKSEERPVQFTDQLRNGTESRQSSETPESSTNKRDSTKKSIIQTLLQEYNQKVQSADLPENSISRQLLNGSKNVEKIAEWFKITKRMNASREDFDIYNGKSSRVFENMGDISPDIPELKTWAVLQQKELKALSTSPPANVFQELILWTEQGKLWKFPINNEQGLEEEDNVHFSEHVFMERHLKGWCPKSGPIRHFMELVCVGLSKNPYLTVQEKINHIMWYKEYFESKQDMLQELGAIQEPFSDKVNQITE